MTVVNIITPATEPCIICGADTHVARSTPVDARAGYVDGVGQTCPGGCRNPGGTIVGGLMIDWDGARGHVTFNRTWFPDDATRRAIVGDWIAALKRLLPHEDAGA